jgi:hypothetical protein
VGQALGHTYEVPRLQLQGLTIDVESNTPLQDLDRYR